MHHSKYNFCVYNMLCVCMSEVLIWWYIGYSMSMKGDVVRMPLTDNEDPDD